MTRTKCVVVTDIKTLANTPKSPEVSLDDFAYPPCVTPRYAELDDVLDGTAYVPDYERARCKTLSKGDYANYRLIKSIIEPYLRSQEASYRGNMKATSAQSLVTRVYEKKSVRSKRITRKTIERFLTMLIEDKVIAFDAETAERNRRRYRGRVWIKLGPEGDA